MSRSRSAVTLAFAQNIPDDQLEKALDSLGEFVIHSTIMSAVACDLCDMLKEYSETID